MANFDLAIKTILDTEDGYQNDPSDKGNYNSQGQLVGTNYGISAKTYEAFYNKVPSAQDMKNLSQGQAVVIYKRNYWDKFLIGNIEDQFIATHVFDLFVNHSPQWAARILQTSINSVSPNMVKVDGVIGTQTRDAVNTLVKRGKANELNEAIITNRKIYYSGLGNSTFISGWIARANSFDPYVKYAIIAAAPLLAGFFLSHCI